MKYSFSKKPVRWVCTLGLIISIYALGSCARGPTKLMTPETMEGPPIKIKEISFREEPNYTRVIVEGSEPLK